VNERIRELKIQAFDTVWDLDSSTVGPGTHFIPNGFEEKFAELIVRECSKIIVNGGYRNPALGEKHPLTPPEIATMIKEHFGVEE
jgi:hypothetical protein